MKFLSKMLYIFWSLLLLFPVFWGFGELFQRMFGKIWNGISAKLISGIILIIISLHILAFFAPLSIYLELILLVCGFSLFGYFTKFSDFLNIKNKNFHFWLFVTAVVFFMGSGFPFILDHFSYYVPTIRWLSEYGLVRGISNLDWVLGQMSPWHMLQAAFSHISDKYLRINVILLSVFLIYIIERKSWVMLVFFPIFLFFVSSPSPDLPVLLFSIIILNEVLHKNKKVNILFAFSVLLFSIKPTMIWVPVFVFLYSIFVIKSNLKFIVLGILVVLLYIVKNLWVFGYPLFPLSFLDFGFIWKPHQDLFQISDAIAIQKTFDFQYSLSEIYGFSSLEYFFNWLFLSGIKGKINFLLLFVFSVFSVFVWIKKNQILYFLWVSIFLKLIIVLLFSAQYRFFMDVFFVVFLVIFRSFFFLKKSFFYFSILLFFTISVLGFPSFLREKIPSFHLGAYMKGFHLNQAYKPLFYRSNKKMSFQIGNLAFNTPKNKSFSFDIALPVLTIYQLEDFYRIGIFPQKIGKSIGEGFVWKKLSDDEKRKLAGIIQKIKK